MTTKAEDESRRVVLSRAHDRTFDSIRLTATVDHFSFWIACIHHYYANTLTSTSRRAVPVAHTASCRLVATLRLVAPHVSTSWPTRNTHRMCLFVRSVPLPSKWFAGVTRCSCVSFLVKVEAREPLRQPYSRLRLRLRPVHPAHLYAKDAPVLLVLLALKLIWKVERNRRRVHLHLCLRFAFHYL